MCILPIACYRLSVLQKYIELPVGPLENLECIDLLRRLENDLHILTIPSDRKDIYFALEEAAFEEYVLTHNKSTQF